MDKQSKSTDDKIKDIGDKLDSILAEKKLSYSGNSSEIAEIFDLGIEVLSRLPYTKISEYAFVLARYNISLQRDLNKEKVLANWAKRSLDWIVLPKMQEYRITGAYMQNEEVKMITIRNNEVASKLYKFIVDKENTILLLNDLGHDIRKMSDYLIEISKGKRFNNG